MDQNVKQDINFLEHPMWMQNEKITTDAMKWTDKEGYTFSCNFGVPTKVDIIFLYFFLLECQRQDWAPDLTFSRHQVLKNCGITPSKKKYQRLEESLEKWKFTGVKFSGKFYNGEKYKTLSFGIINDWSIKEDDKKIRVNLNKFWIEKIKQSKFFKYVSFNQMKTLRSPLALRLYEILVKTFYNRNTWEIGILNLAEKIPMAEKYITHITPKIQAATKRIKEKTDLNVKVQVVKQGRGKGKFIFSKSVKQKSKTPLPPKEADILSEIPVELLDMIPLPDQAGSMNLCRKIFTSDGVDGLRFYLEKTNNRKQNGKSSYSGYLKTISNLNLYADYLVTKKDLEDQVRAEQAKIQEELRKQQEEEVKLQEQRMSQKALRQLEQDHPEKYQKLYDQAVRDLGINSGRLKRGDNLKIIFKMTDILG